MEASGDSKKLLIEMEIVTVRKFKGWCKVCREVLRCTPFHAREVLGGRRYSRRLANRIESKCPDAWEHPSAKPGIREEYFGEGGIMGRGFGIPGRPRKDAVAV